MQQYKGTYYFAGSSACCAAFLQQGEQLQLRAADTNELLWQGNYYQNGIDLPGLAVEVQFDDGSYFVPDDVTLRLNAKRRMALATRLEQHKVAIVLISVVGTADTVVADHHRLTAICGSAGAPFPPSCQRNH